MPGAHPYKCLFRGGLEKSIRGIHPAIQLVMNNKKMMAAAALAIFVATAPAALAKDKGKNKGKGSRDAQFNSTFAQFDRNGDGAISRAEFPGDDAQFGLVDQNRNGLISRGEAQRILSNRGALEQELRRLDSNRDGVISRGEWRGNQTSFDRLDRNGDGVLSTADRNQPRRNRR
jgi:hypothetical protein